MGEVAERARAFIEGFAMCVYISYCPQMHVGISSAGAPNLTSLAGFALTAPYHKIIEEAEMLQDVQDYDSVKAALAHGDEELVHSEVVYAILDGENAIKVWREYRGLSQQEMAKSAGISVPYLSQLETISAKVHWRFFRRLQRC